MSPQRMSKAVELALENGALKAQLQAAEQAGFERGRGHAQQSCGVSGSCLQLVEAAVKAERERITLHVKQQLDDREGRVLELDADPKMRAQVLAQLRTLKSVWQWLEASE